MCPGDYAGGQSPGHQETEAATSLRWGRSFAFQTDGLLLQRGALLCRESGDDMLCEAANPGTGWQVQPPWSYLTTGEPHFSYCQCSSVLLTPAGKYSSGLRSSPYRGAKLSRIAGSTFRTVWRKQVLSIHKVNCMDIYRVRLRSRSAEQLPGAIRRHCNNWK